jgi:hypothetical protein
MLQDMGNKTCWVTEQCQVCICPATMANPAAAYEATNLPAVAHAPVRDASAALAARTKQLSVISLLLS